MNEVELAPTPNGWRVSVIFKGKCYARYYRYEIDAKAFQRNVARDMIMYGDAWAIECNHMYVADPSMYEEPPPRDTKERFLAYKLLEWAGNCQDRRGFEQLPKPQIENATKEAEHILSHLQTLDEEENAMRERFKIIERAKFPSNVEYKQAIKNCGIWYAVAVEFYKEGYTILIKEDKP